MSAKIAPEPITVGVTLNPQLTQDAKNAARPVESISESTADPKGNNTRDGQSNPSNNLSRPPGKDPSIPPQALFDAALIAAENKPNTEPVKVEIEQTELAAPPEKSAEPGEPRAITAPPSDKQAQPTKDSEPADDTSEEVPLAYFGADPESQSV